MSGALPTSPEFNALSFKDEVNTLVSISDSGRRFARQIDNQRWKFTCRYTNLTRAEFAPIFAFITKQRGSKETFTISPPNLKNALGSETTTISVNGAHTAGDNTIAIDGFNADSAGSLLAGDWISFSGHTKIYQVSADVTPSSNAATVSISPPIIEALGNNEVVTYDAVAFTVYLTSSVQSYSMGINNLYNYEFDVCEAF
jgi:hypothetical protein